MNILHHKSWHVRNKDNIERVRRDEAKAAEEEKETQRRIDLAESEARTEFMRGRAGQKRKRPEKDTSLVLVAPSGHINFFQEEEKGRSSARTNVDHEAEKKALQEKHEQALGILTYLGQSSVESKSEKPWYFQAPKRQKTEEPETAKILPKRELDMRRKCTQDPLVRMTDFVHQKVKIQERDRKLEAAKPRNNDGQTESVIPKPEVEASQPISKELNRLLKKSEKKQKHGKERHHRHNKKKSKKMKKKHKHDRISTRDMADKHHTSLADKHHTSLADKHHTSLAVITQTSGGKSLQKLREDRLQRERAEQRRTENLLSAVHSQPGHNKPALHTKPDERPQKYSSQFNPKIVKRINYKFHRN